MPPTFLLFLGFIVYLGLIIVTMIVFGPMLFIASKKLLAKKVFATVLISFPCLIAVGLFYSIIFVIPAIAVSWVFKNGYIPFPIGIVLSIASAFIFIGLVATSSLYLWYFMSKIIHLQLDKIPAKEFLDRNNIYKFIRNILNKHRHK